MKESIFTSLKDIFEAVVATEERTGIIKPYHFLEVLRREHEMFRTAMHQDAHEFLNLLLNEVVANVESEAQAGSIQTDHQLANGEASEHAITTTGPVAKQLTAPNGTKSPNTTRWVHELFEGTLTSETQCLTCEKVSQRDEVFLDLSVDLDQHSSVTSCLRKFSEEEMLCERNKFHCDNCGGLQEAEKRMKIKRLPRILALHLKRFKYTEDLQRLQKLFHRVVYPYHLRLFNTTDDAEDPDRLYELYAVVVHIGGGPYHGHYIAIIKTEDRGWLLFDDEMVEPVDKNYVRNFFGDRPGLACAYVLFYQETTFEAVQKEQEQEGMPPSWTSSETKGLVSPLQKANGVPTSPELNSNQEGIPALSDPPPPPPKLSPISPDLSTDPDNTVPPPPPPHQSKPKSPMIPLKPKKSEAHLKKERAREEKERKTADKEKERAEKHRKREMEAKLRENQKRQEADFKAALEASKASKAEEDRRKTPIPKHKENGLSAGLSGSLGRFKLGSRTLSHSKHKEKEKDKEKEKEKDNHVHDAPRVPRLSESPNDKDNKHNTAAASNKDLNGDLKAQSQSKKDSNYDPQPNKNDGSGAKKSHEQQKPSNNNHFIRHRKTPTLEGGQPLNPPPTTDQHHGKLKHAKSMRSRFGLRTKSFSGI